MGSHDWTRTGGNFLIQPTKRVFTETWVAGGVGLALCLGAAFWNAMAVAVAAAVALPLVLLAHARRAYERERLVLQGDEILLESSSWTRLGRFSENASCSMDGVRRVLLLEAPTPRVGIELQAGTIVWATSIPLSLERCEALTLAVSDAIGASAHRWDGSPLAPADG